MHSVVTQLVVHFALAAHGLGHILHNVGQAVTAQHTHGGVKGAAGAFQLTGFGHNVVACAGMQAANGDHRRLHGVNIARNNALQRGYDLCARHSGIAAQMRHGTMAGFALDHHAEMVAGGHQRTGTGAKGAHGQAGPHMQTEHGIYILHGTGGDHALCAAVGRKLFGGLEDQANTAGNVGLVLGQQLGSAQQHGNVVVVAAGVHQAGIAAGIGQAGFLGDLQSVHIGAQRHALARLAALQIGQNAVTVHIGANAPAADFLQLTQHAGAGFLFPARGLRMLVKFPLQFGQIRLQSLCLFINRHTITPPDGFFAIRKPCKRRFWAGLPEFIYTDSQGKAYAKGPGSLRLHHSMWR